MEYRPDRPRASRPRSELFSTAVDCDFYVTVAQVAQLSIITVIRQASSPNRYTSIIGGCATCATVAEKQQPINLELELICRSVRGRRTARLLQLIPIMYSLTFVALATLWASRTGGLRSDASRSRLDLFSACHVGGSLRAAALELLDYSSFLLPCPYCCPAMWRSSGRPNRRAKRGRNAKRGLEPGLEPGLERPISSGMQALLERRPSRPRARAQSLPRNAGATQSHWPRARPPRAAGKYTGGGGVVHRQLAVVQYNSPASPLSRRRFSTLCYKSTQSPAGCPAWRFPGAYGRPGASRGRPRARGRLGTNDAVLAHFWGLSPYPCPYA